MDDGDAAASPTLITVNGKIDFSMTKLNIVEATQIVASGADGDVLVGGLAAKSGENSEQLEGDSRQ